MLSHEGLPPERETLEYAWQLEIILGRLGARLTTPQVSDTFAGSDFCTSRSCLDGEDPRVSEELLLTNHGR